MGAHTCVLYAAHGASCMASVVVETAQTTCGINVLTITNSRGATLALQPFLTPPAHKTFLYAAWDTLQNVPLADASWDPNYPFVYADNTQQMSVGSGVDPSVVFAVDSLRRITANNIYLHASHLDAAYPNDNSTIDSTGVAAAWRLLYGTLETSTSSCPLPAPPALPPPPPPPSSPCGDSGQYEAGLCQVLSSLGMCFCSPDEVTVSFAAANYAVYLHCQHSCGCCYRPPSAPSSPSPPPPLAPHSLEPCVFGEAEVGSRCFVQIYVVPCEDLENRTCLTINKPFYAAFIKAHCTRTSDSANVALSAGCLELNVLGVSSLSSSSSPNHDTDRGGFSRFVNYFPSREGFAMSAALRGHGNYSTDFWEVAPPISASGPHKVVVAPGYTLTLIPTLLETRIYESPLSAYTPNVAIEPPAPPQVPPSLPPFAPPVPPAPPQTPPAPPPLCSFYEHADYCAADFVFEESGNGTECAVAVNRPVDELRIALTTLVTYVRASEAAISNYSAVSHTLPSTDPLVPAYTFVASRRPLSDYSAIGFEPFPAYFPIALVQRVENCSYTQQLISCDLYSYEGQQIASPITSAAYEGDLYRLSCYDIPHPPSLPPPPPPPDIPVAQRVCQGFRIVISKTSVLTNYYRQWAFIEYMALGILHQCSQLIIDESDPTLFGCYDMASPDALGGDFVSDGEIDILDWSRNARLRNEHNLGE